MKTDFENENGGLFSNKKADCLSAFLFNIRLH